MLALLKAISKSAAVPVHHCSKLRSTDTALLEPQMLFTPPGFAHYDYNKVLQEAQTSVSQLRDIIILADIFRKHHLSSKSPPHQDYEHFLESKANASWSPDISISSHDMVNVQFTSGSTGLPKSVALSQYNIMNCGRNIWLQTRMTSEDRICCPVPLFHSFGMIVGKLEPVFSKHPSST